MFSQGDKIPKVGRVSVDIHGKSYRLRFTYPQGNNHSITIARATPEGWTTTIKAAQLINRDIDLGDFDDLMLVILLNTLRSSKYSKLRRQQLRTL